MASYGIPYQGSKSRIAEWVIDHLPVADTLVDLFAGGCAITHCAMLSGKFKNIICNDLDGRGVRLFRDCALGLIDLHKPVTRKVFQKERDTDFLVSITGSFGNANKNYLYSVENRHKEIAEMMLFGETIKEKFDAYKEFLKLILDDENIKNKKSFRERPRSLQRVESLVRLERLKGLKNLENIQWLTLDYKKVQVPVNAIVYCDPPYKNTIGYFNQSFNHDEFYDWCLSRDFPVFVSEFDMPEKDFSCVAKIARRSILSPADNSTVVFEKLYVQSNMVETGRIMQGRIF